VVINTAVVSFWKKRKQMKKFGLVPLLQVHDELVFEVDEDKAEEARIWVRDVMESAGRLSVPVLANAACGPTWEDAK
jgi:DNA polymerase-1